MTIDRQEALDQLRAELEDERSRANALSEELTVMRSEPAWKAAHILHKQSRRFPRLVKIARRTAIFFLRIIPGLSKGHISGANVTVDDRALIEKSPLFSAVYHDAQHAGSDELGRDSVLRYLQEGHVGRVMPGPLFEPDWYLACNPDVAETGVSPLLHYLKSGAKDGRCGWSTVRTLEVQKPYLRNVKRALEVTRHADWKSVIPILNPGDRVAVLVSSKGNLFFQQIQQLLCVGFEELGIRAKALDETDDMREDYAAAIIVAPHEFFYLGDGAKRIGLEKQLNTILLNTEQMNTSWFSRLMPLLQRGMGLLDINVQSAATLCDQGLAARFLPLGFVPNHSLLGRPQGLPKEMSTASYLQDQSDVDKDLMDWDERPIDALFVGAMTPRREGFFAKHAADFSKFTCSWHLTDMSRPIQDGGGIGVSSGAFVALSQRARILLNIHQGEIGYFEWHRMVLHGFWQKTLVVTETSFDVPAFKAGEHYFQDDLEHLPGLMEWLLRDAEGQARAQEVCLAGYDTLKNDCLLSASLAELFRIRVEGGGKQYG